jgi:nucleotide-binding universal stress UspA family protein
MPSWKKICCGVDFSDLSRVAMDQAAYLARVFEADLTLVHVYELPPAGTEEAQHPRRLVEGAAIKLSEWRNQAEFLAARPVATSLREGHAGAELVRFAREGRFDLVVVGTAGRTGMKHMLLGSVAERVVREAPCPVLVIRHERDRPEWSLVEGGAVER